MFPKITTPVCDLGMNSIVSILDPSGTTDPLSDRVRPFVEFIEYFTRDAG
jgi:hypothetical protein